MCQIRVRKSVRWIPSDSFFTFFNCTRKIAQNVVYVGQTVSRLKFLRKGIFPNLEGLGSCSLVACHLKLILIHDGETLALGYILFLIVCERCILLGPRNLAKVAVNSRET